VYRSEGERGREITLPAVRLTNKNAIVIANSWCSCNYQDYTVHNKSLIKLYSLHITFHTAKNAYYNVTNSLN